MFSPPIYNVYKFTFLELVRCGFDISGDLSKNIIQQFDNQIFRQTRLISGNHNQFNPFIVFVDCKGYKKYYDDFERFITDGFLVNKEHFVLCERSASMTRQGILSFVSEQMKEPLDKAITMDIKIEKTVLAKYEAYRGLMFSSCHCLEGYVPKIIVVSDYEQNIPNQKIKYVVDKVTDYVDKNTGELKQWKQKDIVQGIKDIKINAFDGCGVHHPDITKKVKSYLHSEASPTSIQWRMPYIKGVTHEFDYTSFLESKGVFEITDIWGVKHSIYDKMVIMTESMYKGLKYFKNTGGVSDWQNYWNKFRQYNHCVCVAKWNFSKEEEPVYTRANYQILQDLDLSYDKFSVLAQYSTDWIDKIVNGDRIFMYCFLGLMYDNHKPMNEYVSAILKNPEMINEPCTRQYILSLLSKYIDEMKCGKLWLKATFKILAPDLVALVEHIGGLTVRGCLGEHEFYTNNINGDYHGEYLIERNPHICKSEHTILNATVNDKIEKWCSHLSNVCMINIKSITPQRLNGADFDGDLVLVVDDDIMKSGVDRDCPVVIDVEDKITTISEEYNMENIKNLILRTMVSMIGENSNCATAYHNKTPKSQEQKDKYASYIDLLSVLTGKSIDFSKTGVIYPIPKHIAKYSKPLPYFMKYAGEYYRNMGNLSKTFSNMNRLAIDLEKWEKKIKYKKDKCFDYSIMIDDNIIENKEAFAKIEKIYLDFCREMNSLTTFNRMKKNYAKNKDYFKEFYWDMTKEQIEDFEINWNWYYSKYKEECKKICKDKKELANIAVKLCYEKYPSKSKKFAWKIAADGILLNIKPQNIDLPAKNINGKYEYLGKKYSVERVLTL